MSTRQSFLTVGAYCARATSVLFFCGKAIVLNGPSIAIAFCFCDRESAFECLGQAIARLVEDLGPVAIKVAQMLSYRADLLPIALLIPLQRLQENASRPSRREINIACANAFGKDLESVFYELDKEPFAAGSVAIVLKGRLRQNPKGRVAVKLLRPKAKMIVYRDLSMMRAGVGLVACLPWARRIPVSETFGHISAMIEGQCDLRKESRNLMRLQASVASICGISVPGAYSCGISDAVVMDYVESRWRIADETLPIEIYRNLCITLLDAVYSMIFKEGFVHCDLHPGNILIRNDGSCVLVDAGLMATLTKEDRVRFREFFLALAQKDANACAECIIGSARVRPMRLDRQGLLKEVRVMLEEYHGQKAGEFFVAGFVYRIFDLQRRFKLYGTPGFVSAIWALVMYEGLVRARFPELDFQEKARPYLVSGIVESMRTAI